MQQAVTIFPLGDSALTIDFGNRIDDAINKKVLRFFYKLQGLNLFKDIVPAYSSITVYYDVLLLHSKEKSAFQAAVDQILPLLDDLNTGIVNEGRKFRIPVCYEKKFAPDLEDLALQKGLSPEDVIHLHTAKAYRVYMVGFLPGFPYMGKVDSRIATPRKNSPRTSIEPGAVGIAGEQTGIYPLASPAGWNIVGRTPLQIFDKNKNEPVLLQPGDEITFYSITEHEFEDYQKRHA